MLKILTGATTPILRRKMPAVEVFDEALVETLQQMQETMLAPDPDTGVTGIGIAAPQVGIEARVILLTLNMGTKKEKAVLPMINPEILETSKETVVMEEGCLSLPKLFGHVERPKKIKAKWQNPQGNWCEKKFDHWDARIFQHELDHLNGVLFIDHLTEPPTEKSEELLEVKRRGS